MEAIYIDPKHTQFSDLSAVKGPALFIPLERPEDTMFITGGDNGYAVPLGGQWKGEAIRVELAENWIGMAITGVSVLVDVESAYSPDANGKQLATICKRGQTTAIFGQSKANGIRQVIEIPLDGVPNSGGDRRVAFTRWQIVIQSSEQITVLRTVEI